MRADSLEERGACVVEKGRTCALVTEQRQMLCRQAMSSANGVNQLVET